LHPIWPFFSPLAFVAAVALIALATAGLLK
jgi:hypothetical protein